MTLRIEAGFAVSSWTLECADSGSGGTPQTITIPNGNYSHSGISPVSYGVIGDAFETALNGAAGLNGTYTVTFSTTTGLYTIACDETFAITWSSSPSISDINAVFGFYSDSTGSTSYTGAFRATHVILTSVGARSKVSGDYEPDDIVQGGETDSGTPYAVARLTAPKYFDFTVPMEPLEAVFKAEVVTVPYTWEHFFEHVRGHRPFASIDDSIGIAHVLRAQGAKFRPARVTADWDGAWNIELLTHLRGRF